MSKELRAQLGVKENTPNDWFEDLYANADEAGAGVPWANMAPHPLFQKWLDHHHVDGIGKRALVIGCGMGDDAIALEGCGFEVTAFDVSESAIALCERRFPNSQVQFVTADLLAGIPQWKHHFDFVLEIFTIQALPPKYEDTLFTHVADLVAPNGALLMVTEIQQAPRTFEMGPPWLLNTNYIDAFEKRGLTLDHQITNHPPEMGDAIHLSVFNRKQ